MLRPRPEHPVHPVGQVVEPVAPRAVDGGSCVGLARLENELAREQQLTGPKVPGPGRGPLGSQQLVAAPAEVCGPDGSVLEAEAGDAGGEERRMVEARLAAAALAQPRADREGMPTRPVPA